MAVDVNGGELIDIDRIIEPESFEQKQASGVLMDGYTTLPNIACAMADEPEIKFCLVERGSIVGVLINPDEYAALRGTVNLRPRQ